MRRDIDRRAKREGNSRKNCLLANRAIYVFGGPATSELPPSETMVLNFGFERDVHL
jgi:hypothetical protein